MNLKEYIKQNVGKKVDFDGAYWYQCVDLARDYARNVLGVSLGPSGGSAKTMWENKHGTFNKNWVKIKNNPKDKNQLPEPGDIIFWNNPPYWHVAIVTKVFPWQNKVEVLEQNGQTGDGDGAGGDEIRLKTYKYYLGKNNPKNIAGWFHYIGNQKDYKKLYEKIKKENNKLKTKNAYLKGILAVIENILKKYNK